MVVGPLPRCDVAHTLCDALTTKPACSLPQRKRDEGKGNICFVDIASPDYKPEENENVTFEQSMERIHAIFPNGDIVTDIQAFKAFYEQVGLGWVYAATDIPLVANALNAVYGVWAKYRLPITGRPDLGVILQEKSMCKKRTNE